MRTAADPFLFFALMGVLLSTVVATTTAPTPPPGTSPAPPGTTVAPRPPGIAPPGPPQPPAPPLAPLVITTPGNTESDIELSVGSRPALPRLDIRTLHIRSDIQYRYASTTICSRLANPAGEAQEAVFHVTLPERAFIAKFLMEIDGEVYEAYVKEKEEAKRQYDAAVAAGQSAGHVAVSPRDSSRFQVSVNIGAESKVTFNLTYEELLVRRLKTYEHVINIDPGQVVKDLQVNIFIKESRNITALRVPELRNEVEINKDEKENALAVIERLSPTEAHIRYSPSAEQQEAMSELGLAGQLVVQYDVARALDGGDVMVINGYFVHFFAPVDLPPLPKHVVFVLDTSGSMYGRKMEQTKEAMSTILDDLNEEDFFNILDFNSFVTDWRPPAAGGEEKPLLVGEEETENTTTTTSKPNLVHRSFDSTPKPGPIEAYPTSSHYIEHAKNYVNSLEAGGSTNIHDALERALKITLVLSNQLGHEPIIVFLTDGEATIGVTSPTAITAKTVALNREAGAAIFSLAFGTGADFSFLKKLSLQNNGFARKIYEASDAALQLEDFYKEIANPLLSSVNISYVEDLVDKDSVTETSFHQYYSGSELVVAGKLVDRNSAEFAAEISAHSADGVFVTDDVSYRPILPHPPIVIDPTLPPIDPPVTSPPQNATPAENFLERLWAYLTIKELLKKDEIEKFHEKLPLTPPTDTATDSSGLTELIPDSKEEDHSPRARALKLSLQYGFVTPLTSLVIVKPNQTSLPDVESAEEELSESHNIGVYPVLAASPPLAQKRPISLHFHSNAGSSQSNAGGSWTTPYPLPVAPAFFQPTATTTRRVPTHVTKPSTAVPGLTLQDLSWYGQQVNDSGVLVPLSPRVNDSAFFPLGTDKLHESYQPCNTSADQSGHCRHLVACIQEQFRDDFDSFVEDFCIIRGLYAGVCCPDDYQDNLTSSAITTTTTPFTTTTTTHPTTTTTPQSTSTLPHTTTTTPATVTQTTSLSLSFISSLAATSSSSQPSTITSTPTTATPVTTTSPATPPPVTATIPTSPAGTTEPDITTAREDSS